MTETYPHLMGLDDRILIAVRESEPPDFSTANEIAEQLGYFLSDVPDATPAQIREAVSEFLDRDPRETP